MPAGNHQLLTVVDQSKSRISSPLKWVICLLDTQNKQMDIAIKHGMVRREQESGGLRTRTIMVKPEFGPAWKKVLPEVLQ